MISKNFTKIHLGCDIEFPQKTKSFLNEYFNTLLEALGFTEDWEMRLL